MEKTGAVLLAAGCSSRMGSFKPMLPYGNSTISLHVVTMFQCLEIAPIVVVTGFRSDELEEHLRLTEVRFVKNSRYHDTQMFDSVKLGLRSIADECWRVMIMPMDIPAVTPATLYRIATTDREIVRPVCYGMPGHPLLLKRSAIQAICRYEGDRGLRGAVEQTGIHITDLETGDEGILKDVDTPLEYQDLLQWIGRGDPDENNLFDTSWKG